MSKTAKGETAFQLARVLYNSGRITLDCPPLPAPAPASASVASAPLSTFATSTSSSTSVTWMPAGPAPSPLPSAPRDSAPLSTSVTSRPARSALSPLALASTGLSTAVTSGPPVSTPAAQTGLEMPANAVVHADKGKGKAINRTLRTRCAVTYNLFADTGDDGDDGDDGRQVAGPSTTTTKRARPVIQDSEDDDEEYAGKTPVLQTAKKRQRTGASDKTVPTPSETTSGESNLAYRLRVLPHTLILYYKRRR
ncbi:hypothetical protein JI435_061970 [Parastagonospora nodorum SN15]|uniref:Uncharacterized protein n=1 Tax=Phaeosphaeria nodorum (strain SN15 / ATCC MYA-4574 / FGSC 10173) TaxID=321614 RepID=A0A7U2I0J9_PHANO|nr:hypothetical protein HBH96_111420 [Parastagonospora nodorum]QRC98835.1 hypothetical protein JI435_061970 [Parastagonospora nodorum SN15]